MHVFIPRVSALVINRQVSRLVRLERRMAVAMLRYINSGKQIHYRFSVSILSDVEGAAFNIKRRLGTDPHGMHDCSV